jgi:hypothetical protein
VNFQENVTKNGLAALNLTLDFNEEAVLQENMIYFHNTLEVGWIVRLLKLSELIFKVLELVLHIMQH